VIIFNFGAHRSAEDALRLRRLLDKADIFVKEMITFSAAEQREYEGLLRDLATGNRFAIKELEGFSISNYDCALAEYIYSLGVRRLEEGGKPLRVILEPYDDRTRYFFCYQKRAAEMAQQAFERGDIRGYERRFSRFIKSFVDENLEREKRMRVLIDAICHEHPKAVILVDLGASHAPLYFYFRKQGHSVHHNFSGMVHDYFEVLVRAKTMERLGMKELSREKEKQLMMQVALSNTLRACVRPDVTDSITRINLAMKATSRLSPAELKSLFRLIERRKPRDLGCFVFGWLRKRRKIKQKESGWFSP
jgi:hypothetical protein